jgi:Peptidase C80 family
MICFIEKKADLTLFVATYRMLEKLRLRSQNKSEKAVGDTYLHVCWLEKADLSKLGQEKLYLRGHGSKESVTVGGKSPTELAQILQDKGLQSNSRIKVVGCYSGYADLGKKSFIEQLGEALKDKNISCTITGIKDINVVNQEGQSRAKNSVKNTEEKKKQYRKIIYGTENPTETTPYVPTIQTATNQLKKLNLDSINFVEEMRKVTESTKSVFDQLYEFNKEIIFGKEESKLRWPPTPSVTELKDDDSVVETENFIEPLVNNVLSGSKQDITEKNPKTNLNFAFSEETVLLNGMKVIFDQPVGVYPVTLESKMEERRHAIPH